MKTHERGRLEVQVADQNGQDIDGEVLILLSESKAQFGKQFRLESKTGSGTSGEFPSGPYILQALANGYDVAREFLEIHADRTHKTSLRLKKASDSPLPTVTERLEKRFGIKTTKGDLKNLTVLRGQKIALDYREYRASADVQILRPTALKDLKRWAGSPEGVFIGDHPVFGPLPSAHGIGRDAGPLSPDQQTRLTAIANEYIYGNARAVPADVLNHLEERFKVSNIYFPIFFFLDIVIEDGATLQIGKGSSAFVCDTLTIHPRGTLSAVGNVSADIGLLKQL